MYTYNERDEIEYRAMMKSNKFGEDERVKREKGFKFYFDIEFICNRFCS